MDKEKRGRLLGTVALCTRYCVTLQNCLDSGKEELVENVCGMLPRIYAEFLDLEPETEPDAKEGNFFESAFGGSEIREYADEEMYEEVRGQLARLLGEDDTYLETFEEDMKYSDTPIAATVSEGLADIFQPLYDFVAAVREGGAEMLEPAYEVCHDRFGEYWSQTLCNVMRPLNALRTR